MNTPSKVAHEYNNTESYLSTKPVVSNLDVKPQSIAQFNRIRPKNSLLSMTQSPKRFYGYKEPKIYPKVSYALGSSEYTKIGTDRAVGPCKWGGRSAFYTYADAKQKPIFRNEDVRLQFRRIQRNVCDVIQQPPKMYGEFSQKCSLNLVL